PTQTGPPGVARHTRRTSTRTACVLREFLPVRRLIHKRLWRFEMRTVVLRQFTGTGDETAQPALVLVDVLRDATGPRRETDSEERADVGVRGRADNSLVEATYRLDRLHEQHAFLQVDERHVAATGIEGFAKPWPQ